MRNDFGFSGSLIAAWFLASSVAVGATACGSSGPEHGQEAPAESVATSEEALGCTTDATPVGLAIEVENGGGIPLRVRKGQTFYLNQIDVRASYDTNHDEGVSGLADHGDFADLPWGKPKLEDEEPILLSNGDGTFTRRRFYRRSPWIEAPSAFLLEQVDAQGQPTAFPTFYAIGSDDHRSQQDDFFIRRLRAIQWTYDCPGPHDCAGATHYTEEGLVELRAAQTTAKTFRIAANTVALRLYWTMKPGVWTIPVEQVASPTYDYGFSADLVALTPPGPGGYYAPGADVTFQVTLRDGSGNRLHPAGSLPTYNEVIFGANPPGIEYYRAFFDPTTTYWRRKHRERMMMSQIIGPAQKIQPIRSIAELDKFLGPEDTQHVGTMAVDGVFADFKLFPKAGDLFGGAFDPTHAGWAAPVSDTWTYHIPEGAETGTYLVTFKARRTYMGEDVPFSKTVEIQVGSAARTTANLHTGPCNSCHSGQSSLSKVLHANDNRAACNGCHVPLGFELEGPIYVRTHFIHSRSDRFDANPSKCSNCHLDLQGIQRTSKSACLSCHKSYPDSHVASFGPIESIYVGGGAESFQSCTSTCHTNHPGSGL